jgi:hypothetical protein
MVDFSKRTCFKAGGLLVDKPDLLLATTGADTSNLQAPLYVDNRGLLLPADNQGDKPWCAAYTMATVIEIAKWKKTRERVTIDPAPIYVKAKLHDGNNDPGTYLDSVFVAARKLGLIPESASMRALRTRNDVKFAIREFEVCLLGLMITDGWNDVNLRTGYIGNGKQKLGGHAIAGCWYNDTPGARDNGIGIGNSWGLSWGVNGFGRLTWEQFDEQFMYGLVVENI